MKGMIKYFVNNKGFYCTEVRLPNGKTFTVIDYAKTDGDLGLFVLNNSEQHEVTEKNRYSIYPHIPAGDPEETTALAHAIERLGTPLPSALETLRADFAKRYIHCTKIHTRMSEYDRSEYYKGRANEMEYAIIQLYSVNSHIDKSH